MIFTIQSIGTSFSSAPSNHRPRPHLGIVHIPLSFGWPVGDHKRYRALEKVLNGRLGTSPDDDDDDDDASSWAI